MKRKKMKRRKVMEKMVRRVNQVTKMVRRRMNQKKKMKKKKVVEIYKGIFQKQNENKKRVIIDL